MSTSDHRVFSDEESCADDEIIRRKNANDGCFMFVSHISL